MFSGESLAFKSLIMFGIACHFRLIVTQLQLPLHHRHPRQPQLLLFRQLQRLIELELLPSLLLPLLCAPSPIHGKLSVFTYGVRYLLRPPQHKADSQRPFTPCAQEVRKL